MAAPLNPNYDFLHKQFSPSKFILLQGSARSGKTYSIYHFIIWLFTEYPNAGIELDVIRDSYPVLRGTILKEFVDLLEEYGLYNEANHNMSEHRININGNFFNYYSVDTEIKARGRKRHILWLNEPNNINRSIVNQLLIRTTNKIIIDYNPSDPIGTEHWLYDDIAQRPNAASLITTYKDNPFLTKEIIEEIELNKDKDPDFYNVFGLGQRAKARSGQIFTHVQRWLYDMPQSQYFYGLDFGKTNDPTCLVRCCIEDNELYLDQLIYQTNLTSSEIVGLLKYHGISTREPIYADSAEPLMIREIKDAGFKIMGADKGRGSVSGGIDKLKTLNIKLTDRSKEAWREVNYYCWKLIDGKPTNEPMDMHNHFWDAVRYAIEHLPDRNFKRVTFARGNTFTRND